MSKGRTGIHKQGGLDVQGDKKKISRTTTTDRYRGYRNYSL